METIVNRQAYLVMKRQAYLDCKVGDPEKVHRAYYAQFVTQGVRDVVARCIGVGRIQASVDPHFNDIPLLEWDRLVTSHRIPAGVADLMRQADDSLTLGGGVCLLKEAARQIREGSAGVPSLPRAASSSESEI